MLIRFNVKNFLSFSTRENGQSQEFSMIAGKVRNKKERIYDDNKIKLLKFAAVYGANAAGKSNLVKAIDFMKKTVTVGLPKGHTAKYCKMNPSNIDKESYFELGIMLNKKYYTYGFEVVLSSSKFTSEWLYELTEDNQEKLIFTRETAVGKFEFGKTFKNKTLIGKLQNYAEDIKDDTSVLLLTIMNQNKKNLYQEHEEASILKDIYEWININLDISYPNEPISNYSYLANAKNVQLVCNTIAAFGTGITNFQIVAVPIEKVINSVPKEAGTQLMSMLEEIASEIKNGSKSHEYGIIMRSNQDFFIVEIKEGGEPVFKTIQFAHGGKPTFFNLDEESDGTVRLLDLIEILIDNNKNKTYIIDELDRCLHPSLSYKFVEIFLQLTEQRNIQLIVTTHESRLMDFDLLRRDEIWFVNKKDSGESDIYSLEEYNARFDQRIDKAYLEGRYGGVPVFSTVFPVREE